MSRRTRGAAAGMTMAAALAAVPGAALALGHAGDLDPTFNGGAPVQLQLARSAPASTFLQSLILDGAGRILVSGGSIDENGKYAGVVARLTPGGALDPGFAGTGSRILQLGGGSGTFRPYSLTSNVFLAPNGAVGAGVYRIRSDERGDHSAFELRDDGTPDVDFGAGGLATSEPVAAPKDLSTGTATAGPDGSVYVGGSYDAKPATGTDRELAITKFTKSGLVATGYGTNAGTFISSYSQAPVGKYSGVSRLVVLPNNKLLAVGSAWSTDSRSAVLLARFSSIDGSPDPTFGTKPGSTLIQARDTGGSDSTGADVAIGPDNAIYVAGTADDAQHHMAMLLMKFTASGEPDYQFGTNGIKRFQVATAVDASYGYSFAQDVVLQPDGKILLIGGTRENATDGQGAVLRVLPNGNLDPSFGSNGIVRLALAGAGGPRAETFGYGGAVADGRLLMTGSIGDTTTRGYVARILLDALPDPGPGGPGQPGGGTPPGGGGTIPVAPRGVLKLAASSLSVDSHGRVHVPLTCSATGPCTGKVLVVASDGTVVVPTASKARRAVTYAAGAYALKAGAKKTLALKLRTKGRSALRAHRKLTVRLVLAPTGQKATTKRIKLVAPKRR